MARPVPNIPFKVPITNKAGLISDPWAAWFHELFLRVGGNVAPSNSELNDLVGVDYESLVSDVETLQATALSLQFQINGLNQDPAP